MATEGQIRWTKEQAAKDLNGPWGGTFQGASLGQVIEHYLYCYQVTNETAIAARPREWWGMSHEQIVAHVEALAKKHRKGAGLRALKAKLGRDGAEDYISWKAGRRIHLK